MMSDLTINFKIWLETETQREALGDDAWKLLKTIDETGSMTAAIIPLGLNYRATWNRLNKIEEILGFPVIDRQRGGITGGKTVLTPYGKAIVIAFDRFHAKYDAMIAQALAETVSEIKQQLL
jgi:molybdate transport system regulatory protein